MATYTASEVNGGRSVHAGLNVVRSRFVGALTVSEVCLLARIPHGATLVDWKVVGGNANAASTGSYKIGISPFAVDAIRGGASLTEAALHSGLSLTSGGMGGAYMSSSWSVSASIMVPNFAANVLPLKISVSDDAAQRYVWLAATAAGASITGTHSLDAVIFYIMGD